MDTKAGQCKKSITLSTMIEKMIQDFADIIVKYHISSLIFSVSENVSTMKRDFFSNILIILDKLFLNCFKDSRIYRFIV